MKTDKSRAMFRAAQKVLPGGVNSPVRAFRGVGGDPLFIERGEGAYIFDADGNRYVDFVMSWGPLILGHAHPLVVEAIQKQAALGTSFGAPTGLETDLANFIIACVPSIEMLRFVNSGTEATMSALRLARAVTGRDKIIKFEGCYHGHADFLLVKAGSGVATLGLPDSPGVPPATTQDTLTAPFNDIDAVRGLFAQFSGQIAAVIVEPVAGNMGLVPPVDGFLQGLRDLTSQNDALLIFDEVMTGFRVALGGAQVLFGVMPDITALGKVIGGGLPVGAYGGKRAIMEHVAPAGTMYQAGTLSGNPLAMAAGLVTLQVLNEAGTFERIARVAEVICASLEGEASAAGIPLQTERVGSMFGFSFRERPAINYAEVKQSDTDRYARFFHAMLKQGVYFAPSAYEAAFAALPHEGATLDDTLSAIQQVIPRLLPSGMGGGQQQ
jgi:glutamate-1-semialdehyde 2,1-aminomutase